MPGVPRCSISGSLLAVHALKARVELMDWGRLVALRVH
jgi:hypothetical protein